MPSQRHHEPGDLYVKFLVNFPDSIDPAVITSLESALPPRKPVETFGKGVLVEEALLDQVDSRSQRKAQQMGDGDLMDEDGDEPRVQCANQ